MGIGLVFTREVKIDIRLLITLESEESLKRYIKTVLYEFFAAYRTHLIGHVHTRAPCVSLYFIGIKIRVMT